MLTDIEAQQEPQQAGNQAPARVNSTAGDSVKKAVSDEVSSGNQSSPSHHSGSPDRKPSRFRRLSLSLLGGGEAPGVKVEEKRDAASSGFAVDLDQQAENELLLKVLRGLRKSPLSQKDFQEFLDQHLSGELSRFFVEAEKHETRAEEKVPQAIALAREITDHYIKPNAEEEINISDQDRKKIVRKLQENEKEAGLDPTLFRAAKKEVVKLLSQDKFRKFLDRQMNTNINEKEVRRRRIAGYSLLIVSFAIVGLLMWIQTIAAYPFNLRWWRLIVYPVLIWGVALILSARAHVCAGLASKCVRMRENETWYSVFFSRQDNTQTVQDELVMNRLLAKAQQLNRNSILYSVALMVVLLVLPPGYGILADG